MREAGRGGMRREAGCGKEAHVSTARSRAAQRGEPPARGRSV